MSFKEKLTKRKLGASISIYLKFVELGKMLT